MPNIILFESINQFNYLVQSLKPGTSYLFKVRARNIYGYGNFSNIVSMIPSAAPAMMNEVNTTLSYPYIYINFVPPFNNGLNITSYSIQIYSYRT